MATSVLYSFCRVMDIKSDGSPDEWNRDRWFAEMAPFAPVLAAMITVTVERTLAIMDEEDLNERNGGV